ncbi:MAG TPA: hypothetical protein VE399_11170 [Gemmatimonadales bacterium]|nr:hypothetical protein [Gemmatimonadales bacterium]
MRFTGLHPVAITAAALLVLAQTGPAQAQARPDQMSMQEMMSGWPKASKEAATFMKQKYGPPSAMSKDMMVWGKAGPWKRTIVYAREYPHEFPMHHTDVMQQFIDYKASADTYDELARYDGSVVVERTSGEISARCDKEGANFLALNLAHDIVTGKRSVQEARKMYGEQIMAMKAGKSAPYTEKLLFQVPERGTGDPDQPVMGTKERG